MKKPQIWDPYVDFQKTVLPNGLTIYSSYQNRPWMCVRFCVHSGSLCDPPGKEGLAHFVEHLISKRSGALFYGKLRKMAHNAGGSADFGGTSPYRTVFYFEMPLFGNVFKKMLEVFADILTLSLEAKYLERERNVIQNEFRRYFPVREKFDLDTRRFARAYIGTRFERYTHTLGNPDTIASITMSDLTEFFTKHYVPANISIIAVGGMEKDAFLEEIQSSVFSKKESGMRNEIPNRLGELPYPSQNEDVVIMSKMHKGINFDISSMGSYAVIPGTFPIKTVSILSKVLRSVLYSKIREKSGSTYDPKVEWEFMGDSYDINIILLLQQHELTKMKDSIVYESLQAARKKSHFLDYRRYLIRSYWINDVNIGKICKSAENDLVKFDKIYTVAEEIELLQKVTYQEYLDLIDYLSDMKRWWSLICVP